MGHPLYTDIYSVVSSFAQTLIQAIQNDTLSDGETFFSLR
jgi:hypothetical protein